ncbi:MAG: hypothetical protein JW818_15805 [Pirellulales bacterium]|nr:hypothetical protein [Pirellulales bacterium]
MFYLALLFVFVLLPMFFLGGLYFMMRSSQGHRYRPYVFEPITIGPENTAHRAYFEEHSCEIEQLGFSRVGDFLLLPKPKRQVARFFLSPDGCTIADVSDYNGTCSCSFSSIFTDGKSIESSSVVFPWFSPIRQLPYSEANVYIMNHHPGMSMEAILASHEEVCQHYCQQHECQLVPCEPQRVPEFSEFIHRLSRWDLYEKGYVSDPPAPGDPSTERVESLTMAD